MGPVCLLSHCRTYCKWTVSVIQRFMLKLTFRYDVVLQVPKEAVANVYHDLATKRKRWGWTCNPPRAQCTPPMLATLRRSGFSYASL